MLTLKRALANVRSVAVSLAHRRPSGPKERRTLRRAVGLLILVWVVFHLPMFGGRVLFPVDIARWSLRPGPEAPVPPPSNYVEADAVDVFFPFDAHLGRSLRQLDLPLWDPHRFAGTPFAANPTTAIFYPPNWFFAAGSTIVVFTLLMALSKLAALLLAYWLFRVLRLHPYAAAAGAIVFSFSGFFTGWGVHQTQISSAIWLPLALGGLEVALRGRRRRGVALCAAGLALSMLGSHPQIAVYAWIAVALWALVRAGAIAYPDRASAQATVRSLGRTLLPAGAAFALATGLASIPLLATSELAPRIARETESYESVLSHAIPGSNLVTFLLPDAFGNHVDGNWRGHENYTETTLYVGIFGLVLASVALWKRRDSPTLGFAAIAVVGGLSAFGTPFYRLLYFGIPGLAQARGITRFVYLLDAGLAGLSALGMDLLIRQRGRRVAAIVVPSAVLTIALLAAVLLGGRLPVPASYLSPQLQRASMVLLLGTGVAIWMARSMRRREVAAIALLLLLAGDLWMYGFRYHGFHKPDTIYPRSEEVEFLRSVSGVRPRFARIDDWWFAGPLYPPRVLNAALQYGLYDIQGYDSWILSRTVDLVGLAEEQRENTRLLYAVGRLPPKAFDAPVMDLLGVRSVVGPPDQRGFDFPRFTGLFSVYDRPTAMPPAFLTHCWELLPETRVLDRLRSMSREELRSIVIVEDTPAARRALHGSTGSSCRPGPTAIVSLYSSERIRLQTSGSDAAILVLTDAWYPGWRATVDGRPVDVLPVDWALRGVPLEPGPHDVELVFVPTWLGPGIAITLLSLLGLAGVLAGWDRPLARLVVKTARRAWANRAPPGDDPADSPGSREPVTLR